MTPKLSPGNTPAEKKKKTRKQKAHSAMWIDIWMHHLSIKKPKTYSLGRKIEGGAFGGRKNFGIDQGRRFLWEDVRRRMHGT